MRDRTPASADFQRILRSRRMSISEALLSESPDEVVHVDSLDHIGIAEPHAAERRGWAAALVAAALLHLDHSRRACFSTRRWRPDPRRRWRKFRSRSWSKNRRRPSRSKRSSPSRRRSPWTSARPMTLQRRDPGKGQSRIARRQERGAEDRHADRLRRPARRQSRTRSRPPRSRRPKPPPEPAKAAG